jgi:hypothetical protein
MQQALLLPALALNRHVGRCGVLAMYSTSLGSAFSSDFRPSGKCSALPNVAVPGTNAAAV